jgi:hypothetical protein
LAGHLDHHEYPTEQVVPHNSLKLTSGNPALTYGKTKISSSAPGSCHSKPATHNSLSSSCCLLLIWIYVLQHPDARSNESNHSVNFETIMFLSFRSAKVPQTPQRSRMLCSQMSTRLLNVRSWSQVFSNLFSLVCMNFST